MIDPLFGRAPKQGSRWAHGGTETCGGGKSVSGGSLGFWGNIRIYRPERGVGRRLGEPPHNRAHPPPWARPVVWSLPRAASGLLPKLPGLFFGPEKIIKKFRDNWTSFGTVNLKAKNMQ